MELIAEVICCSSSIDVQIEKSSSPPSIIHKVKTEENLQNLLRGAEKVRGGGGHGSRERQSDIRASLCSSPMNKTHHLESVRSIPILIPRKGSIQSLHVRKKLRGHTSALERKINRHPSETGYEDHFVPPHLYPTIDEETVVCLTSCV